MTTVVGDECARAARRLRTVGFGLLGSMALVVSLGLSAQSPAARASEVASREVEEPVETPVGDSTWEDLELVDYGSSGVPAGGSLASWDTLKTNAITGSAVDLERGQVYAATRYGAPASLFATDLNSNPLWETQLPTGSAGAWDVALSGNTIAVGVHGAGAFVAECSRTTGCVRKVNLPDATQVMALVEDTFSAEPGNGRFFWAGTYDAEGAKLFRVDLGTGKAVDHTPAEWAKEGYRYVRSLACDSEGVTVGVGNRARVWRLTSDARGAVPTPWEEADEVVSKADGDSVYAAATYEPSCGDAQENGEQDVLSGCPSYSVLGISGSAARLLVVDNKSQTGKVLGEFPLENAIGIDRIAVEQEEGIVWFTSRPQGHLHRIDLKSLAVQQGATQEVVATPVEGSETRAMAANGRNVYGVSGTSDLWDYSVGSGETNNIGHLIPLEKELTDTAVQGIAVFNDQIMVGGHWRYQAIDPHAKTSVAVPTPGEPKAQVVVGDRMFSAVYPSAQVGEIVPSGSSFAWKTVASIGHGQSRPSSIDYSEGLKRLIVSTGPEYGLYGGGVTLIDPNGEKPNHVFPRPVGEQRILRLVATNDGAVIGTATNGEAMPYAPGSEAFLARWDPLGDPETGRLGWKVQLDVGARKIGGVAILGDPAGKFVVATTDNGYAFAADLEDGTLLWQRKIGSIVTRVSQRDDYVLAVVDGYVRRLIATRSGVLTEAVGGLPNKVSYVAVDAQNTGDHQSVAAYQVAPLRNAVLVNMGEVRSVTRLWGENRYATAAEVSGGSFLSSDVVLLARGDEFPDALSAGPLAAEMKAPVLLTRNGRVPPEVAAEISRLGATRAIPIGGFAAVPQEVSGLPAGVVLDNASRLAGETRYGTSVAVAERLRELKGAAELPLVAATGSTFPDAIAAGPAASSIGGAVLLVGDTKSARAETSEMLKKAPRVDAVGGPAARTLQSMGVKAEKTASGPDRYATAGLVAENYFRSPHRAYVASGVAFPDALTAAAPAGMLKVPIFLVRPDRIPEGSRAPFVKANPDTVAVVGGPSAVSSKVFDELQTLGTSDQ